VKVWATLVDLEGSGGLNQIRWLIIGRQLFVGS